MTNEELKSLIRKVMISEKQIEYLNNNKNSYNIHRETLLRIYKLKNFKQIKETLLMKKN